jgi:hypothetical protein
MAFSPNGRFLATWGSISRPRTPGKPNSADLSDALHLWDINTGRDLRAFPGEPTHTYPDRKERYISAAAFSFDGKTLASVEADTVVLHEVATGGVRRRLKGHLDWVTGAAFDPNGRELVTVSYDNTALVWDLSDGGFRPMPGFRAQMDSLWVNLRSSDAQKAYQAIWALANAPAQSVPFLTNKLRPAPAIDSSRIKQLIADLDSDVFKTREKAATELQSLGDLAMPELRKVLSERPLLEVQRAIERLLEPKAGEALSPDQLQALRAIEGLEHTAHLEPYNYCRSWQRASRGRELRRRQLLPSRD